MSDGDCFRVAALLCAEMASAGHDTRLVHGTPVLEAGPHVGERYWHAWVEDTMASGFTTCLDYSNGHRFVLQRAAYYRRGQLEQHHVYRYSPHSAHTHAAVAGHWGPWAADPKGVTTVTRADASKTV